MQTHLLWTDIALRIFLTLLSGSFIGYNRGEHGRGAGLRTTTLVCLSAAISMILVSLILVTTGKTPDSFVQIDPMRLPLGILSGMGFIGGGAILRKENMVLGVTTAATLWFSTMVGLCFGAGFLITGGAMTLVGAIVLWGFSWIERQMKQDHRASLSLTCETGTLTEEKVLQIILGAGFQVSSSEIDESKVTPRTTLSFDVRWRAKPNSIRPPDFLNRLNQSAGLTELKWKPASRD